MARLRKKGTGWSVRLRFGEGQDSWFDLNVSADAPDVAEDRRKRLQRIANLLKAAGKIAESRAILEQAASERGEKAFHNVETVVEAFSPEPTETDKPLTFREVAQLWTSGKLHERFPDDVARKEQEGRDADQGALAAFFPAIGDKAIAELTDQDIEAAKACIPKDSAPRTRAAYCKRLRFVLRLAVNVLKAAPSHPVVTIPKAQNASEFTFLYPEEEAKLARCGRVPFAYRFLYAFLARNGTRISETLKLTWDHVDLKTGTIHIDKAWTKTKRARFFMVEPDVLAALRLRREELPLATVVFTGRAGNPLTRGAVRIAFQPHLLKAGIDRPEAIGEFTDVRALTIHDLRASFVTLARLRGMNERWIRDHSGHRSTDQANKYDRFVRHAEELHLGWFHDMWRVLGMVDSEEALAQVLGQRWAKTPETPVNSALLAVHYEPGGGSSTYENPVKTGVAETPTPADVALGPAGKPTLGQNPDSLAQPSGAEDSPVERALAFAIEEATKAKRWDVVMEATRELSRRQLSRTSPGVSSLDAARKRRDEGGGK